MGQIYFCYTLNILSEMPHSLALSAMDRCSVTRDTLARWQTLADQMRTNQQANGLYEQHDGYFDLPHQDIAGIPQKDFPLYSHWSYDRLYRTDMIKQPDILMLMYLYPEWYSQETTRVNYEFYAQRCIHESSLSPGIHAILACRLGLTRQAKAFFKYATRLDLDDYNNNTGEGLHNTGIAAAWSVIVFGFAGLRAFEETPALRPFLPENWTGYTFQVLLKKTRIQIEVSAQGVTLTKLEGPSLLLQLYDQLCEVKDEPLHAALKDTGAAYETLK